MQAFASGSRELRGTRSLLQRHPLRNESLLRVSGCLSVELGLRACPYCGTCPATPARVAMGVADRIPIRVREDGREARLALCRSVSGVLAPRRPALDQLPLSSPPRCCIAYTCSSGCRASRASTHAVRASMPGPNSAARRRACHVVRGASAQRASEKPTRPGLAGVPSAGSVPLSGEEPGPPHVVSATRRVSLCGCPRRCWSSL